jgi:RNA polymerase sigma-70 factor (ECF subfamily)
MARSARLRDDRETRLGLNEQAIRDFLAEDYPRLVAAVALVSGSRAVAEDAVQEALARAWERSERGDRIVSLKAWVITVSMNLARSGLRRLRAERRARERLPSGASAVPSDHAELVDLRGALMALPRRQREATVLRYYLDLDVAEVAAALRISEGTAKTTLHRARRSLATALHTEDEQEVDPVAGP